MPNLATTPIMLLGFPEDSLGMLQEGERLSKELGDDRRLGNFHARIANYYMHKANFQLSIKYAEDAIEVGFKNQDIELIAPTAQGLFASYMVTGQYYKIADKAPGILDLIEKSERESDFFAGPLNKYSTICAYCGISMGCLGNFKEGNIFFDNGLRAASKIDELTTIGLVELWYGYFLNVKGNWKLAIGHLQNAIKCLEEVKWLLTLAVAQTLLGYAYFHLGDSKTGKRHAEKGLGIQLDSGVELGLSAYYMVLGNIHNYALGHLSLGELYLNTKQKEVAVKNLKKAEEMFQEMGMDYWLSKTQEVLAKV